MTNKQTHSLELVLLLVATVTFRSNAESTNSPTVGKALVIKHDLNGNGKIDVNERKPYVRELSRLRREEAKTFATKRPVLSQQERQFYRPPRLTPDLVQQYDTDHNGKLDMPEQLALLTSFAEAAKQEFRRYDGNNDGKLDKEELKAAHQAKQAKVSR